MPIGEPRRTAQVCGIDIRRNVNAVDCLANEGEWKCIPLGCDSCAAVSVTPKDLVPGPIEVTSQVGDEYTTANNTIIYNEGQQKIKGYPDYYVPINTKLQVTDVHRPLLAVADMEDNNNTVVFSKKHGSWVINDLTGTATAINRNNRTYSLNAWVFTRQA